MKRQELSSYRKKHRAKTIFTNAGIGSFGKLHIFRKTFATRKYEEGWTVKQIAAYIGDLESTTQRYYIAVRKKVRKGDETQHVVMLPDTEKAS